VKFNSIYYEVKIVIARRNSQLDLAAVFFITGVIIYIRKKYTGVEILNP